MWNDYDVYQSIDAFSTPSNINFNTTTAGQKTAMIIDYSRQISVIQSKNPNLNYGIAPVPQQEGGIPATYADYWGWAVKKNVKDPVLAWQFIKYLTDDNQASAYLEVTHRPPALRSLIPEYQYDTKMSVFANQILIAKSWRQPDNAKVTEIFKTMIRNVLQGAMSINEAVYAADSQITELFQNRLSN